MANSLKNSILLDCRWIPPAYQQQERDALDPCMGLVFEILLKNTPQGTYFQVHVPPSQLRAQDPASLAFKIYKQQLPDTIKTQLSSPSATLIRDLKVCVRVGIFSTTSEIAGEENLLELKVASVFAEHTRPPVIQRPCHYTLQLTADPRIERFSTELILSTPNTTAEAAEKAIQRLASESATSCNAPSVDRFPETFFSSPPSSPSRSTAGSPLSSPSRKEVRQIIKTAATSPPRRISPGSSPTASSSTQTFVFPGDVSSSIPTTRLSHSLPTSRAGSPVKKPSTPLEKYEMRRTQVATQQTVSTSKSPPPIASRELMEEMQQAARNASLISRLWQSILLAPLQTTIINIENAIIQSKNTNNIQMYDINPSDRRAVSIAITLKTALLPELGKIRPNATKTFIKQHPRLGSWNTRPEDQEEMEKMAKEALIFLTPSSVTRVVRATLATVFRGQAQEVTSYLDSKAENFMTTIFEFYGFSQDDPKFTEV